MFNHKPTRIFNKLKTKNINNKRHYITPKGSPVPSVTTVCSILSEDGIKRWREDVGEKMADYIMIRSQTTGTEFHKIIEAYLKNEIRDSKRVLPKGLFAQTIPALNCIDNIQAQEMTLFSEELGLAGTVDCIAEFDCTPSIIDFKSADKKKKDESYILGYFVQATAYSLMFQEMTGQEIKQIVIIISAESGDVDVYIRNRDDYIPKLKEIIEIYNSRLT